MNNAIKLYAAYKAGFLGNDIFDTYFSFFANIIVQNRMKVADDVLIANKFEEKYGIKLPLPFVRQVLGVGVENKCFVEDHGKYSVIIEKVLSFQIDESGFQEHWNQLIEKFCEYCMSMDISITSEEAEKFALNILDESDDEILGEDVIDQTEGMEPRRYAWYSFVRNEAEDKTELYSFIASISASNIMKEALFYTGESAVDYRELCVYLDSPIIFALLGMDDEARTESYRTLLTDLKKVKCSLQILDHNLQEIEGIVTRASKWARSTEYDMIKANNVARFFHDSAMSEEDIAEYCSSIEDKLNEYGITVKKTDYDVYQNKFQEDEAELFGMIQEKYLEHGYGLSQEKKESIRVDVRSIVMIYRERRGQAATKLQNAKHLMLTSNNVIANVSKKYESNRSINSGHIPACVSADLFGAILWLDSPLELIEYQKYKLLADCYGVLKPNKQLLNKYMESLEKARRADQIDEKKFLFLRTHSAVIDSLMNITRGDYARFNSQTYLEVYDDIEQRSLKKYRDEAELHQQTRDKLKEIETIAEKERKASQEAIEKLTKKIEAMENDAFQKRVKLWGNIATFFLVAVPCGLLSVLIELIKARFSEFSWASFACIAVSLCVVSILTKIAAKGKRACFKWVTNYLRKK